MNLRLKVITVNRYANLLTVTMIPEDVAEDLNARIHSSMRVDVPVGSREAAVYIQALATGEAMAWLAPPFEVGEP